MIISRAPENHRISCQGQPLELVQQFKYLASVISANGKGSAEINQRLTGAGNVYLALNKSLTEKLKTIRKKGIVFNKTYESES